MPNPLGRDGTRIVPPAEPLENGDQLMTIPAKPRASFRKRLLIGLAILLGVPILGVAILAGVLYYQVHRTNGEVLTGGRQRSYLLYVPKSYQPGRPTPLVISLHGFAEWPAHLMEISRWNRLADEFGFLVVYPSGTGLPLRWHSNGMEADASKARQDVQFISDLIDHLAWSYTLDTNRVYANGLSNGAGMSFLLACRLSERIAAMGGVSGAYLLPWTAWQTQRPVPAIIFHGTTDPIVPFHGGLAGPFHVPLPDIPKWVKTLAAHDECQPTATPLPAVGSVSGVRYNGSDPNSEVVFYAVAGGGHSWPGGKPMPRRIVGHTTQDIDATRLMWDFFQRHPKGK